jgi:hypothetical protein
LRWHRRPPQLPTTRRWNSGPRPYTSMARRLRPRIQTGREWRQAQRTVDAFSPTLHARTAPFTNPTPSSQPGSLRPTVRHIFPPFRSHPPSAVPRFSEYPPLPARNQDAGYLSHTNIPSCCRSKRGPKHCSRPCIQSALCPVARRHRLILVPFRSRIEGWPIGSCR